MNILVVGGTSFLGRHTVEAALANGHTVTLFNRGKTNPDLFPELEKLRGDRKEGDYTAVAGRHWDAIIDPSAYYPRAVRELLETALCDHYTFISTISVYADNSVLDQDESAEIIRLDDPTTEEVTGATYGGLKLLCEEAAASLSPNVLTVRSGLIVGPHDPSDRFTYWPVRIAQGGKMLAPSPLEYEIQVIDVRDQAEWIIRCVESGTTGTFNVAGPQTSFGDIFAISEAISSSRPEYIGVDLAWCIAHEDELESYYMPLWAPMPEYAGFHQYNIDKAVAAGLTFRPIKETVQATLDWHNTRPSDYELKTAFKSGIVGIERKFIEEIILKEGN